MATTTASISPQNRERLSALAAHWPLALGFLVLALPTMATLGREVWVRESGAHGPIVLATGAWLLMTQRTHGLEREGPGWGVALLAIPALALYTFGRAYDFIVLEAAGVYGMMLAMALRLIGLRSMLQNWFPFLYLGFMVPPPDWVIDKFTSPLRVFVSIVVTKGLQLLDYPITRDGVTMTVAQYSLLVEDACSGMNSIIGLTAVTLLYIYLMHKASWRYCLLLLAFVLPVAIIANMVRVTVLVLLTYHFGDAVAQGFLHVTTGLVLFMFALGLIFLIDALLQRLLKKGQRA